MLVPADVAVMSYVPVLSGVVQVSDHVPVMSLWTGEGACPPLESVTITSLFGGAVPVIVNGIVSAKTGRPSLIDKVCAAAIGASSAMNHVSRMVSRRTPLLLRDGEGT